MKVAAKVAAQSVTAVAQPEEVVATARVVATEAATASVVMAMVAVAVATAPAATAEAAKVAATRVATRATGPGEEVMAVEELGREMAALTVAVDLMAAAGQRVGQGGTGARAVAQLGLGRAAVVKAGHSAVGSLAVETAEGVAQTARAGRAAVVKAVKEGQVVVLVAAKEAAAGAARDVAAEELVAVAPKAEAEEELDQGARAEAMGVAAMAMEVAMEVATVVVMEVEATVVAPAVVMAEVAKVAVMVVVCRATAAEDSVEGAWAEERERAIAVAQGEVATVRCPGEMAAQMATEVGIRAMVVRWAGPTGVTVDEEVVADWAVVVLVGTEAREQAKEVEEVEAVGEGMAGSRTSSK